MINPVKQFYSKNRESSKSVRRAVVAESPNEPEKKPVSPGASNAPPKPLPKLCDIPKPPPPPKRMRLVLDRTDSDTPTFVVENRAYPGEAARNAALSDRERNLFVQELEFEELRRRALHSESVAAERDRNLRELEALLSARELLLEEKEKRMAQNSAPMVEVGDAAFDQLKRALDQREETLKQAQAALDSREEKLRQREQQLLDADSLTRLKADLERREKELKAAQIALQEREEFLESSENLLCEKGQMLVEREVQLDQLEDELNARMGSVAVGA